MTSDNLEEQEHKEVITQFGLAAFFAQSLEIALTSVLLCHAKIQNTVMSGDDLDKLEASLQQPLGHLIQKVQKQVELPADTEELIKMALPKRNLIIHRFFKERAFDFATRVGREQMLSELREIQAIIWTAEKLAKKLLHGLAKTIGITEEMVAAEADEMRRKVRAE